MTSEIQKVELHPAFMFDCPSCGKENFLRAIYFEEMNRGPLPEGFDNGSVVSIPETFICQHCKAKLKLDEEIDRDYNK